MKIRFFEIVFYTQKFLISNKHIFILVSISFLRKLRNNAFSSLVNRGFVGVRHVIKYIMLGEELCQVRKIARIAFLKVLL